MGEHVNMQVAPQPAKPPVSRPAGFVRRAQRLDLQRRSIDGSAATRVPPIVHNVLRALTQGELKACGLRYVEGQGGIKGGSSK